MSLRSRLRSWLLTSWLVGSLASCAPSVGEFTRAQCDPKDNYDDDGDGLKNCADPDCWVYDFCLTGASATIGEMRGGLTGHTDAGATDATTPVADADTQVDRRRMHDPDASPVFVCSDSSSCGAKQICIEGACVTVPKYATQYMVSVTSAALPDQAPPARACFDNALSANGCFGPGILNCGNCEPDPYIVVTVNGTTIATSSVKTDTVVPTWDDFTFAVTLKPTDELVFTIYDHDDGVNDDTVFWCVPDLAGVAVSSVVRCVPDPKTSPTVDTIDMKRPWSVTATFTQSGVTPE